MFPLIIFFMILRASLGATHSINWAIGTSETLTVGVGDTINFNWNDTFSHNVQWSPPLFQTTNNEQAPHMETYTIPADASGQFYTVICGIHPSMQLSLTVLNGDTAVPTAAPTIKVVTATTESEGMTTVAIFGVIVASIGLICTLGVIGWSYIRYKRRAQPMKIEASSSYRMSKF